MILATVVNCYAQCNTRLSFHVGGMDGFPAIKLAPEINDYVVLFPLPRKMQLGVWQSMLDPSKIPVELQVDLSRFSTVELSFRKLLRLLPVFANVACALSHHWLFVVNPHVPFTSRAKPPPAEAQREIEGLVGHQSRRCVLRDHLTHVKEKQQKKGIHGKQRCSCYLT
ncbi:uncharacterized protein LOC111268001 isoform X2 [Varroa jacobsoni]|uniref:uncharacterized protein LOC111268001 isoform X2 n=1 Tax=Varroa jacobsoni TaxID=62625 RepID=UPI000BF55DA0|nr:uncharacterized protein LOC111268001 isoform X2 [Varroa jacobsoni]